MKWKLISTLLLLFISFNSVSANIHRPPYVSSPEDITYVAGTTGNEISWIAEAFEYDDYPGVYFVTRDGEVLPDHNGYLWEDNVPIIVNIDGLDIGNYTYKIEVRDSGYPNFAYANTDTVKVTVVEGNISLPTASINVLTSTDTGEATFLLLLLGSLILLTILFTKRRN